MESHINTENGIKESTSKATPSKFLILRAFYIFIFCMFGLYGCTAVADTITNSASTTSTAVDNNYNTLTGTQLNNIDLENDININIWTVKGSYRDIQALAAMVDQDITTLRLKGIQVPYVNWTDITQIGSVNWTAYGWGQ